VTHPTGPVASWSWSRGVRAEPPSSPVIPGAARPLIRCTAVVLWVSSEIRAFWGSIRRMICRRFGPGEWRISEHEVAPLASNRTDPLRQGSRRQDGPDARPTRALRCSPGPPDTAKMPRKASGATIFPWVAGHADSCQPKVPGKPAYRHRRRSETCDGNRSALSPVNGRFVCSGTGQWASRKGLPGRLVMAQNRAIDGIGRHRNSLLRVRRNGRRCDGSPVNR
jgi:hypothetical protein